MIHVPFRAYYCFQLIRSALTIASAGAAAGVGGDEGVCDVEPHVSEDGSYWQRSHAAVPHC